MCLAQGHNAFTPVRLEPVAHRSRVKHSTTDFPALFVVKQSDLGLHCLSMPFWQAVFKTLEHLRSIEF